MRSLKNRDNEKDFFPRISDGIRIRNNFGRWFLYRTSRYDRYEIDELALRIIKLCNGTNSVNKIISLAEAEDLTNRQSAKEFLDYLTSEKIAEFADASSPAKPPQIYEDIGPSWVVLHITNRCNLRCHHCYVNAGRQKCFAELSFSEICDCIDQLKEMGVIDIIFTGGEPLINAVSLKYVLEYCREKYGHVFEFKFRINTNASLINSDIAETLKEYDVKPAISLDGLRDANDRVRMSKDGKATFDQIIKGIQNLRQAEYAPQGFSATVTEENFNFVSEDLIYFAKREGFIDLRMDLDVIHFLSIPVETAVIKLLALKQLAREEGINFSGFWERPIENLNASILEKHIAFCGGVAGKSMCVSPSGEVYICGYSGKPFANLSGGEIKNSSVYNNIVTGRMAGEIKRCKGCSIEGQCLGGCFITEEFNDLNTEAALSYNCSFYRRMTDELLKNSLKEAIKDVAPLQAERRGL